MNRFSWMDMPRSTNETKKMGAVGIPQSAKSSLQKGPCTMQSARMEFQASPVDMWTLRSMAWGMSLKWASWFRPSSRRTPPNNSAPRRESRKYRGNSRPPTLARETQQEPLR